MPSKPFVVADQSGQRHVIIGVNPKAAKAGLKRGMTVTEARAIEPMLSVVKSDPDSDDHTLDKFTVWLLQYSPLVAPDYPDGFWIDATGVDHLFGGEAAMMMKITMRLQKSSLTAATAIADTPGAAWAYARYGSGGVIASGAIRKALSPLPVAALRLSRPVTESLVRVGIKTVSDLLGIPRATIPHRFGPDVMRRLDQALGNVAEPISPIIPPDAKQQYIAFAEPIGTADDLKRTIDILCERLCHDLEKAQEGARKLDLLFHRSDGQTEPIRIGTSRPTYDAKHLAKMFKEKVETVDPGLGVDSARLMAWATERVVPQQITSLADVDVDRRELAELTDKLRNRLGFGNVYQLAPVESYVPERAVKRISADLSGQHDWPGDETRPWTLLCPPEPVDVIALLPDHPPARMRWRGYTYPVKRADGPESITGEWWVAPNEIAEVRDYFRIETDKGQRFWLYRDSRPAHDNTLRWYIHGIFA